MPYQVGDANDHYFSLDMDFSDLTRVPQKTCAIIPPINPTSAHVGSDQGTESDNEDAPVVPASSAASRWGLMELTPILPVSLPRRTCSVKYRKEKKKGGVIM